MHETMPLAGPTGLAGDLVGIKELQAGELGMGLKGVFAGLCSPPFLMVWMAHL